MTLDTLKLTIYLSVGDSLLDNIQMYSKVENGKKLDYLSTYWYPITA